jgi:hypothetical protein
LDLNDNPQCEALSYEWGDGERVKEIFVNGIKAGIARNLWSASTHLRDSESPRALWVDAVRINQANGNAEKNEQVKIMSSIYQQSQNVLVWLGTYRASNELHRRPEKFDLDELQRNKPIEDPIVSKNSRGRDFSPEQGSSGQDREPRKAWKERIDDMINQQKAANRLVHALIHDEYWKRAWIVQEVVLAPKTLTVCSGSEAVPWDEFIQWVSRHQSNNLKDIVVNRIIELDRLRQLRARPGEVLTLPKLLNAFKDAFSTKAHDKIYAFIGLAHDTSSKTIPVDYEKSLSDVYHNLVHFIGLNQRFHHASDQLSLFPTAL